MAERRPYQGYDYEQAADGSWHRVGQSASSDMPGTITVGTPDPTYPTKGPQAAADLAGKGISNRTGAYELGIKPTKDRLDMAGQIADRYTKDPRVSAYMKALKRYTTGLGTKDTPAGDQALIYAFAGLMDPDSAVREGEQQAVSNSDTIYGRTVARLFKELGSSGTFSPTARQNLRTEMRNAIGSLNEGYIAARQDFGEMAQRYGIQPVDAIGKHAGLRFSAADAKSAGITEAKRDFYGNIIEPSRPIGGIPNVAGSPPPPSRPPIIDTSNPGTSRDTREKNVVPTGTYSTAEDRQLNDQVYAAYRKGASFADLNAMSVNAGRGPIGNADKWGAAIQSRNKGRPFGPGNPAESGNAGFVQRAAASTPGAVIGGIVNGLTLGGLDEGVAGARALINGTPFSQELKAANETKQLAAKNSPWAYGAGNIIGGVVPALGIGAAGIGTSGVRALVADAGLGAAGGALENNDNRIRGAVIGGLAGGALGAGGRKILSLRGKPGGIDLPIANTVEKSGVDAVLNRLNQASSLGVPMSLADASPSLTALAGSATRLSPEAERIAIGGMIPRARGQIDRFGQAVERDLGPLSDPRAQSEALLKQAQTDAAPLYEQAYSQPIIGTPNLDAILATPFGRQGIGKAHNIAANERVSPEGMGIRLDESGNAVLEPSQPMTLTSAGLPGGIPVQQMGYTTRALDYAKRGMDDVLEQYRNPVTGRLDLTTAGRAENGVRSDLLREMDTLNPAYGKARAAYAGPMELRDALAAGQDAVRQTPRDVQTVVARSTGPEMDQMRLGYRVGLNDRANDMRYSSNPFSIMDSPAAEQRLSSVYGADSPGVGRFLQQRDMERELAGTTNQVLGNSATAKRLIADQNFVGGVPDGMIDMGADILTGRIPATSLLRTLAGGAFRDRLKMGALRGAEQRAEEMAPTLFNTDTSAVRDMLGDILARTSAYRGRQKLLQPYAGSTGAVIGGMVPGYLMGGD